MSLRDRPIRKKLMSIMLLTSGLVLLLTVAAFLAYEFLTFRQSTVSQLSTIGRIIATNSTAALAFRNQDDAHQVLAALKAERHLTSAALYEADGRLFAVYPEGRSADSLPATPEEPGFRFEAPYLVGYEPVVEGGRRLGTLYLQSDMGALYERMRLYGLIAALVIAVSFAAAYLVARKLQSQISHPILTLAETAKAVSERQDYSVRAPKLAQDELGLLTDAFNQMLMRIQQQNVALRESEERVRAVVNSALSAVVVTDGDGRITDWNTRAETMFGFGRSEAIGQPLEQTIVPAARRETYQLALQHSLDGGVTAGAWPIETVAARRDRREFPVELAVSPLRTSEGVSFCSFITDITERKQAVEKLHAQLARHSLLNRITRAIGERQDLSSIFKVVISSLERDLPVDAGWVCLYDPARQRLRVSGVGAKSLPVASALELTEGADIPLDTNGLSRCVNGQLVYEPDISGVDSPFTRRLATQGLRSLVVAPLAVESQVFGALMVARWEPASFGSPECEFLRQLSEHVALAAHQGQIHAALQHAYDDLRHSQQAVLQHERLRALGEMASGIAHDINNAVSPVALYSEMMLQTENGLSVDGREYLETINRAMEDVAATVARLREFYRPREPQVALAAADLNQVVRQVLHLTRARWLDMPQQHGITIKTVAECAPDLPVILGIEGELREALTNLIFNGVDAMPQGGTLTIRTSVTGRKPDSPAQVDEREVHVEVVDTGVGMDEPTRQRCLEPFFTTKGERGTGLGLAMVYGALQRHGADISIESVPGKGTNVRLTFAVPTQVEGVILPTAAPQLPPPLDILVVDDDPLILKALRDALETGGHRVVTAAGGQAGMETFRKAVEDETPFAVVITDLGMPYVDGRQVARAVKQAAPHTPVIMLTGWGQRMVEDGDTPNGVDRVLSKPPKLREINAALVQLFSPNNGS